MTTATKKPLIQDKLNEPFRRLSDDEARAQYFSSKDKRAAEALEMRTQQIRNAVASIKK